MLIKFENSQEKEQFNKNLLNLSLSLDVGSYRHREAQKFIVELDEADKQVSD